MKILLPIRPLAILSIENTMLAELKHKKLINNLHLQRQEKHILSKEKKKILKVK